MEHLCRGPFLVPLVWGGFLRLGLIGFVLVGPVGEGFFVMLFAAKVYVGFVLGQIGFVLQKKGRFVEDSRQT